MTHEQTSINPQENTPQDSNAPQDEDPPSCLTATGYTRVYDELARELGLVAAAVFGRVWWYARGPLGRCVASQGRIANDLGLSRKTVNRKLGELIDAGFIKDLTGSRRYRPHELLITDKLHIPAQLGGTTRGMAKRQSDPAGGQSAARAGTKQPMLSDAASLKELKDTKRKVKNKELREEEKLVSPSPIADNSLTFSQMINFKEIRLYLAITGHWPYLPQAQLIIDCIRQHGLSETHLMPCYTAWITRGHNPRNLAWLLEWAAQDHIPGRKKGNPAPRTHSADLEKYTSGAYAKFIVGS